MKQSLYRLPDILIIHIKRFNMTARFREKIRAKVEYPLQDLDMRPFTVQVVPEESERSSEDLAGGGPGVGGDAVGGGHGSTEDDIYDLYGVSNHLGIYKDHCKYAFYYSLCFICSLYFLGGMSGGHYTAFIRPDCIPSGEGGATSKDSASPSGGSSSLLSFSTPSDEKVRGEYSPTVNCLILTSGIYMMVILILVLQWLLFDDEYVQEVSADKVVSEAAYVLFYKRKNMTSSNIINLTV